MSRPFVNYICAHLNSYLINFNNALFQSEYCVGIGVIIKDELGKVMVSLSQSLQLLRLKIC